MTMTRWPATCPRCNGAVVDTLWSDHTVPIYSCGSLPYGAHVGPEQADPSVPIGILERDELENVTIPTADELEAYAYVVQRAVIAWTPGVPSLGSRIGLCEVAHCERSAIDGRCMEHAP